MGCILVDPNKDGVKSRTVDTVWRLKCHQLVPNAIIVDATDTWEGWTHFQFSWKIVLSAITLKAEATEHPQV